MEQLIPQDKTNAPKILESQIRECFGRVVYSHKTHEKCADQCLTKLSRIKIAQIVLSAVTTGGLIATIFGSPTVSRISAILSAIFSTALLALNTYTKDNDPGQSSQKHKETADKLWAVRESYLSLLTDIRSGEVSLSQVRDKRDELQITLASVYSTAPRTSGKGYSEASKGLKEREELTFSDEEIDKFLPLPLRSKASG